MRIAGINRISEIYKTQQTRVEASKVDKRDEMVLSDTAKDYQYAFKAAKNTPDVRTDEIGRIKERIQTGTYNIEAKEVGEKIMRQFDMKG